MALLTGVEFDSRLNEICNQYGLTQYREWIAQNNSVKNTTMLYHTTMHMDGVALLCLDLLPESAKESHDEIFSLLAAALIHDMDHTLGEFSDDVNIQNAISALHDWIWQSDSNPDFKRLEKEIEKLILITQFPYTEDRVPQTVYEKVLRDADILWGVMPGRAVTIVEGLRGELVSVFPQYAFDDHRLINFVYDRIDFLRSLVFCTEQAKRMFERYVIQHKLEMLDYINSIKRY